MQLKSKQNGMTFISVLVLLCVAGFFVMVGFKIGPVYLDHFTVKETLQSLESEPFVARKSPGEIRTMITNRLSINSIDFLEKEHIKIVRSGGITNIEIDYHVRKPLIANIDVVMIFNEKLELPSN